ncbi:uncharacterized protein LOC128740266 [Sabethes cyaneus]|uniref:uncharacterized protein LOC128740266 n=1 Tax=Sabethes cyaneus TaxID=53552 RepID=UPI00237E3FB2|nr:uncharacterized protein LOC128740266 [Sabethes cyaneus]
MSTDGVVLKVISQYKIAGSAQNLVKRCRTVSACFSSFTMTKNWKSLHLVVSLLVLFVCIVKVTEGNPCQSNQGTGNIPNPDDCTKYYLCVDEHAFPMQCSDGLIFDMITNACNREADSVCIQDIGTPPTAAPALHQ